jgi:alkanesulfonate monooxygenase SsuD/methylene tetrahydromethanopterin reductase-like flavin-dependent oxidoreductase (luciferase family)
LTRPYVIAAVNVIAADTEDEARSRFEDRRRALARRIFSRGSVPLTDTDVTAALQGPQGRHVDEMMTYTAKGKTDSLRTYLEWFRQHADADELMVAHHADTVDGRLHSLELLAEAMGQPAA